MMLSRDQQIYIWIWSYMTLYQHDSTLIMASLQNVRQSYLNHASDAPWNLQDTAGYRSATCHHSRTSLLALHCTTLRWRMMNILTDVAYMTHTLYIYIICIAKWQLQVPRRILQAIYHHSWLAMFIPTRSSPYPWVMSSFIVDHVICRRYQAWCPKLLCTSPLAEQCYTTATNIQASCLIEPE